MANNISVLDSDSAAQVVKTTDTASVHTPHHNVDSMPATAAEAAALPGVFTVVAGDDGTDTHPLQVDASGRLKITQATVTILRAAVSISADGNLIAAGTNKLKILGLFLMADADLSISIKDGSGGSSLTGNLPLAVDGNGFVLPVSPIGMHWIETSAATALYADITGTGNITGCIVYHDEA